MIDVRFEGATLRASAPPVTLILEGTQWDARQQELAGAVVSDVGRLGAATRLAFWSDGVAFDAMPPADYATANRLAERGRFVTPLVEAGILSGTAVVAFVGGRVYDWDDWLPVVVPHRDGVAVSLGSVVPGLSGCTVLDAATAPFESVQRAICDALGLASVMSVSVTFVACAPADAGPGVVARRDDDGVTLEWDDVRGSLELPVRARAAGGVAHVRAVVWTAAGSLDVEADIPELPSVPVDWRTLGAEDGEWLRGALESYASGDGRHPCRRCGETHAFTRAFSCGAGRAGFLASASDLALPLAPADPTAAGAVFALDDGRLRMTDLRPGPVTSLGDDALIAADGAWSVVADDGHERARLVELWPGLCGDSLRGPWVVTK